MKILDFGCGSASALVEERARGLNVLGCDMSIGLDPASNGLVEARIVRAINATNYAIPFDDAEFDMVVSHQVLEHVQNYDVVLRELRRVLKAGGVSIHIFPSRYTPIEPHVNVPCATIWRSKNWLKFWAYLGVRNEYQHDLFAIRVAELNWEYLRANTNYLTKRELRQQFSRSFSRIMFVEKEYLAAGDGYGSKVAKVPLVPSAFSALVHRVIAVG